jgi:glyoxylase-like metal-dependent hydrolase (beta-lactamase superfamily II)
MAVRLWSIEGNAQRLDGGAMFGNAPRALWSRWTHIDDQHRIPLATRGLLVVAPSGRQILLETGIGAFFPPALRERYGVEQAEHVLLRSLEEAGTSHAAIDVVVLSHLHFDHAGGLLAAHREGAPPELLFPNAEFVVSRAALERAKAPHVRDRASFIPELPLLLEASGRLRVVDGAEEHPLGPGWCIRFSNGHTPGMLLAEVDTDRGPILFGADLFPGAPWIHAPITMGYDRFAEALIDEKLERLSDLAARGGHVFFTHDPSVCLGRVALVQPGRFSVSETHQRLSGESW